MRVLDLRLLFASHVCSAESYMLKMDKVQPGERRRRRGGAHEQHPDAPPKHGYSLM